MHSSAGQPTLAPAGGNSARERILQSAYHLFSSQGIRGVGIDAIITHSGVARMTLYRHFSSKQKLVLAFLARREERWTVSWLEREVETRTPDAAGRLLAVFEIFDDWFQREDFEGCAFINVLLEGSDRTTEIHQDCIRRLARIREFLARLAAEAFAPDPDALAHKWHLLMKGAIISALEGDQGAARRAAEMGRLVLVQEGLLS